MEETKELKKLSYEELEKVAHELHVQCQKMYSELQNANMVNAFKRLEYLFKVVEQGNKFSEGFLNDCIKEIQDTMTVPNEEVKDEF